MYLAEVADALGTAAAAVLSARRATSAVRNQGEAGFFQGSGDYVHVRLDRLDPRGDIGEGEYIATWTLTLWRSWPTLGDDGTVNIADVDACSALLLDDAVYLSAGLRHVRDEDWLMPPTIDDPRSKEIDIGALFRVSPGGGRIGWALTVTHPTPAMTALDECPESPYG